MVQTNEQPVGVTALWAAGTATVIPFVQLGMQLRLRSVVYRVSEIVHLPVVGRQVEIFDEVNLWTTYAMRRDQV